MRLAALLGLALLALPATLLIRNLHGIQDWQRFLAPFNGRAA